MYLGKRYLDLFVKDLSLKHFDCIASKFCPCGTPAGLFPGPNSHQHHVFPRREKTAVGDFQISVMAQFLPEICDKVKLVTQCRSGLCSSFQNLDSIIKQRDLPHTPL